MTFALAPQAEFDRKLRVTNTDGTIPGFQYGLQAVRRFFDATVHKYECAQPHSLDREKFVARFIATQSPAVHRFCLSVLDSNDMRLDTARGPESMRRFLGLLDELAALRVQLMDTSLTPDPRYTNWLRMTGLLAVLTQRDTSDSHPAAGEPRPPRPDDRGRSDRGGGAGVLARRAGAAPVSHADAPATPRTVCFNCGVAGHKQESCPQPDAGHGRFGPGSARIAAMHSSGGVRSYQHPRGRSGAPTHNRSSGRPFQHPSHHQSRSRGPADADGGAGGGGRSPPTCFKCGEHGHHEMACDSAGSDATTEGVPSTPGPGRGGIIAHLAAAAPAAEQSTDPRAMRLLVDAMAGDSLSAVPVVCFLDTAADCCAMSARTLSCIMQKPLSEITLLPSRIGNFRGLNDGNRAPVQPLGSAWVLLEFAYTMRDRDSRGAATAKHGKQYVRVEIVASDATFNSIRASPDTHAIIIGSPAMVGDRTGMLAQIVVDMHQPQYEFVSTPIASRAIAEDGSATVTQVPVVSSVPVNPGGHITAEATAVEEGMGSGAAAPRLLTNAQTSAGEVSPSPPAPADSSPQEATKPRHRIDRLYRREHATGPLQTFAVGDRVILIRPPADKMTHGAVGPYVVVSVGDSSAYYSIALLGPEGHPTGLPTRAASGQLRPFDMSRTTPAAEWQRLVETEFGDDDDDTLYPTRRVASHRPSRRSDKSAGDLEFEVVWITHRGDVTTWEPAHFLTSNEHFNDYVRAHGLQSAVRKQARRERARLGSSG